MVVVFSEVFSEAVLLAGLDCWDPLAFSRAALLCLGFLPATLGVDVVFISVIIKTERIN